MATSTEVRRLWLRILFGFFAVCALVAAGAFLSQHATPGSPRYGLRSGAEFARLIVADGAGRVELRIGFASDRIDQAKAMLAAGDWQNALLLIDDSRTLLDASISELPLVPRPQQFSDRTRIYDLLGQVEQEQQDDRNVEAGETSRYK